MDRPQAVSGMQIVKNSTSLITNYEVLQILKEKTKGMSEVESQALQYIMTTPAKDETREGIARCLTLLDEYNLTKFEKMQIINLCPSSGVEVHLLIENFSEREPFKSRDQEEVLKEIAVRVSECLKKSS